MDAAPAEVGPATRFEQTGEISPILGGDRTDVEVRHRFDECSGIGCAPGDYPWRGFGLTASR